MPASLSVDRNHAIVIGGSMAGLPATRVLADHYHRVTLVEHDVFPPQGNIAAACPKTAGK